MGFLTTPSTEKSKLLIFVECHYGKLSFLSYTAGIIWFCLLAFKSFNAGTYFSENALLPGLVDPFYRGEDFTQVHERLKTEVKRDAAVAWILAEFRRIGLDVYSHNFSAEFPYGPSEKVFAGRNVYGILRAPRHSSTESIVLSAPLRLVDGMHPNNLPALALMLSLAKEFKRHTYWAKDVIFLMTEHEQLGIQAWLEAYHHVSCGSGSLRSGDLSGRSGSIQAAFNLEVSTFPYAYVEVKIEGLNGQLPNLDLVNLAHRLCGREGIWHTMKHRAAAHMEQMNSGKDAILALFNVVKGQSTGIPNGNHGLFLQFGIPAVTLEAVGPQVAKGRLKHATLGMDQLGRAIEGMFRSLNNLLERFHQSFFFYLLPSSNRYISIGMYFPSFALLVGGVLLRIIVLWTQTLEAAEQGVDNVDFTLFATLPTWLVAHVFGLTLNASLSAFDLMGQNLGINSEQSVFFGLLTLSAVFLFQPWVLKKKLHGNKSSVQVLHCIALIEFATCLFSLAVYNFSLALILGILCTPVALMISDSKSSLQLLVQRCLILMIHPLSLLFFACALDTYLEYPGVPLISFASKTFGAANRAVMYSIMDSHFYGNWLFSMVTVLLFPTWTLLWNASV